MSDTEQARQRAQILGDAQNDLAGDYAELVGMDRSSDTEDVYETIKARLQRGALPVCEHGRNICECLGDRTTGGRSVTKQLSAVDLATKVREVSGSIGDEGLGFLLRNNLSTIIFALERADSLGLEIASLGRAVAGWEAAYADLEREYVRVVAASAAAHDELARVIRFADERNHNA